MITNLSSNNSPNAIRRYRDNYDKIFKHDPIDTSGFTKMCEMSRQSLRVLTRMLQEGSDDSLCALHRYENNFNLIYDKEASSD